MVCIINDRKITVSKFILFNFNILLNVDKIFKTSEKLYCVLDGSSMHFYKKPTDKKKLKSLSLTGKIIFQIQFYLFH